MSANFRRVLAAVIICACVGSSFALSSHDNHNFLLYLGGALLFLLPTGIIYALFDLFTHNDRDIIDTKFYLGFLAAAILLCYFLPGIIGNG